jgi:peptide/nickel transport system substrate-binding protein
VDRRNIASPDAVAHASTLADTTDGAGPYTLDQQETVAGDQYTFVPNKYYYDPSEIKFKTIVVKIIPDASSRLEAAVTGQVDVAVGDVTTAAAAAKAGLNVIAVPAETAEIIIADHKGTLSPPLADARVRQALNYAIDRSAIATGLLGKYAVPTSEMLTPDGDSPAYQNYYPYDPAKARQLLAAAGYAHGFTVKVVVPAELGTNGVPFALAVAKYLSAVGVTLQVTSEATQAEFIKVGLSGTYPLVLAPWTGSCHPLTKRCSRRMRR